MCVDRQVRWYQPKGREKAVETLTLVPSERFLLRFVLAMLSEMVKPEVCDLDHETTVHHTVRTLQVAMAVDLRAVEVRHTLCTSGCR